MTEILIRRESAEVRSAKPMRESRRHHALPLRRRIGCSAHFFRELGIYLKQVTAKNGRF